MTVSHQGTAWCFRMAPVKIPTLIIITQRKEASWNIFPLNLKFAQHILTRISRFMNIKKRCSQKSHVWLKILVLHQSEQQKQMSPSLKEGIPLFSYVSGVIFVAPRYLLLSMRRPLLHFSASLLFWRPSFSFQQRHKTTGPKRPQGDPDTNNEPVWLNRKTFCQIVRVSQLPKGRDVLGLLALSFTHLHKLSEQPGKYILNIQYSTLYFPQLK